MMLEAEKTRDQLCAENTALRQRIAVLEATQAAHTRTEEALQASERRYRHLMEHSLGLLCIHDLDGTLLEVNTAAARALGYHPKDGVGRSLREFLAPAVQHQFDAYLERIRQQPTDSGLLRLVTRTGQERVWLYQNVRYEAADIPPYVLGHALDITERVQAEQKLKQVHDELEQRVVERTAELQRINAQLHVEITERKHLEDDLRSGEAHFRSLVQNMSDIIALITLDGTVHYYSPSIEHVLGYCPDELIGRHVFGAIHPEDVSRVKETMGWLTQHPGAMRNIEVRLRHRDGSWRYVDVVGSRPLDARSAGCIVVNAREITERKQAEEALRASEARYRALYNHTPVMMHSIDPTGAIINVNSHWLETLGYTRDEVLGKPSVTFLTEASRRYAVEEVLPAFFRTGTCRDVPYQMVKRNGEVIDVLLSAASERDRTGAILYSFAFSVDITAHKRAEEERKHLEAQLHQGQKMEALGTLAGGIAHEFNNMLAVILGFAELATREVSAASPASSYLQEIQTASLRAKDLVQQILAFSRTSSHDREPVRIALVIQEALKLLRASLPTTIDMRQQIAPEAGMVLADTTQIHQVLINLCANAEYAMRETGGVLDVRVDTLDIPPSFAAHHPNLQPGPHVRVTVRDTGPGIAAALLGRIFEPFFTTKGIGEGTGMGLAIVHGIVASHGGAITVESTLGAGTAFTVYLPQIVSDTVTDTIQLPDVMPQAKGRILFVDDEEMLARLGQALLVHLGYDVVACTSSLEALETFRADSPRFDVVITDQTMPGMTGATLVDELRSIRPDIPIILCTGFSHLMNAEKAQALGVDAFVMKPGVTRELALTLQQVLDKRAARDT